MEHDIETSKSGTIFCYKKGTKILHREDGPAIEFKNGDKIWYINGKLHRDYGPAVIWCGNWRCDEWWINGKRISLEKEILLNRWWYNKNGI